MIINHNIPALNTYNKLMLNNTGMSRSLEKLSSGLRINRAADDAAGLAISEKMRAQIRGLDQASRNAQDGISMIQTAEGALNETHSILQRMRELAVQAANDTYTSQDRAEIQKEINTLTAEVDRIAGTTQFNTKNLLNGDASAYVSTDRITTRVFMRDGLRVLDQFGQKAPGGGNYRLDITATVGKNQVQKTDIFKIKHGQETETATVVGDQYGNGRLASIAVANVAAGSAANAGDTNATFTLKFEFEDGQAWEVQQTDLQGFDGADIAALVQANANLNARLTVAGAANSFSATAKDPGQNFIMTATVTKTDATAGTFDFGAATATGATTDATSQTMNTKTGVYTGVAVTDWTPTQATRNITEINEVSGSTMQEGYYQVSTDRAAGADVAAASITNHYSQGGLAMATAAAAASDTSVNASALIEIVSVNAGANTAVIKSMTHEIDADGNTVDTGWKEQTINLGGAHTVDFGSFTSSITFRDAADIQAGDKLLLSYQAATDGTNQDLVTLAKSTDLGTSYTETTYKIAIDTVDFENKNTNINFFQLDSLTGNVSDAKLTLTMDTFSDDETNAALFQIRNQLTVDSSRIGTVATLDDKLYDVDKFWDASGNFILANPQTITLVQGDGKSATITLGSSDTFRDVRDKLNNAIAEGLGQKDVPSIGSDTDKFVSYVTAADPAGLEALQGTFVIRSAIAGSEGRITFTGDDAVLAALSLTTIQTEVNNTFTVDVTEVHQGVKVAENVKISDNNLVGIVHQNVDVQFASTSGINVTWDENAKDWKLEAGTANKIETFVHLADNTTVFHIGANQKQDIGVGFGNMGARALGVNNLSVMSNPLANEAIGKLDGALSRVSSERSKMGALQNRLDHTINNLTTTSENLTAAESRIRDVDMAKEMMDFTKYQILANAATAMLAQANQMPQTVLQLLR